MCLEQLLLLHLYIRIKLELRRLAKERVSIPEATVTCYSMRAFRHIAVHQSRHMTVILDLGTLMCVWGGVHILFCMPQVPQFLEGLEAPWLGDRKGIAEMAEHEARVHKRLRMPKTSLCSVCLIP